MKDIVMGIDIGSSKVGTLICRVNPDKQIEVLGRGIEKCKAIRKGLIGDVDSLANAIAVSVKQAQSMAGVEVDSAFVNIPGTQINIVSTTGTMELNKQNHEISVSDIDRALETSCDMNFSDKYTVIDVIPKKFIIDGEKEVLNPLGYKGSKLEVDADIVTGLSSQVDSIVKSMKGAGVRVEGFVVEPMALGELILTDEEKEKGFILVDIGGRVTNISVFKDGELLYSSAVAAGGDHITNDISIGLDLPFYEAEKLKREYQSFLSTLKENDRQITIKLNGEDSVRKICVSEIADIIEARIREIFELSKGMIDNSGILEPLKGGVVLTGAAISTVDGASNMAFDVFGIPVRVASFNGMDLVKPEFATAKGVVRYVCNQRMKNCKINKQNKSSEKVLGNKKGIFKKIVKFFNIFF